MRLLSGLLVLSAAGPALANSVLVVAENDLAREAAAELVEPFGKSKVKTKFAGPQSPASQCLMRGPGERPRCLAQAGETAFVEAVLLVSAAASKGRTTVSFLLLSLDEGRVLKRETATGPSDNLGPALAPVAQRLARLIKPGAASERSAPQAKAEPSPRLEPAPKVEPTAKPKPETETTPKPPVEALAVRPLDERRADAPKATSLEPRETLPPASVVAPTTTAGDGLRAAAWTTTGLAGAAAVVAGTCGALGLSARDTLEQSEGRFSPLSRSQANALASQANTNFSVALGAGIGAAVLGAVSAVLWSKVP
ncbi:MAG: hypothetical protein INH41_09195 [Myxococcaceae bacterium]|nr:hypothetical protein [Myxococcaceae bacterium]